MVTFRSGLRQAFGVAAALALPCCGSPGASMSTASATSTMASSAAAASSDAASSATEAGDSTTGDSSGRATSTGPAAPLELGEFCYADDECASEQCWFLPENISREGLCALCTDDEDCEFGCSVPNIFNRVEDWYIPWPMCNEGALGEGCVNDDACQRGLQCVPLLQDLEGFAADTCSVCESDAECPRGQLCSPTYQFPAFGYWSCVDPGTVELGGGCDPLGSGATACESGICAVPEPLADFIGVCSECATDRDCGGDVCVVPPLLFSGLVPNTCE